MAHQLQHRIGTHTRVRRATALTQFDVHAAEREEKPIKYRILCLISCAARCISRFTAAALHLSALPPFRRSRRFDDAITLHAEIKRNRSANNSETRFRPIYAV